MTAFRLFGNEGAAREVDALHVPAGQNAVSLLLSDADAAATWRFDVYGMFPQGSFYLGSLLSTPTGLGHRERAIGQVVWPGVRAFMVLARPLAGTPPAAMADIILAPACAGSAPGLFANGALAAVAYL